MDSLEKLQTLQNRDSLSNLSAAITILKPVDGSMQIVNKKSPVKVNLSIRQHKFYVEIPTKYSGNVCLEYIDLDLLELIDVTKLPRKLIVFDIELPVPF